MRKESFTRQVKEELCSNEYPSKDRLRALLAAYIRINGSLVFRDKKSYLTMSNENAKIARFIYETINNIYEADAHLSFSNKSNLAKNTIYTIEIQEASETIIEDLDISFLEGKISKNIVRNDDTMNFAKWLSKLFSKYRNSDIEPKVIKRREQFVIYFKKSDQISNFLIMIGAVECCMEFENVRANRDMINSANRLTNMDTANMKRIYDTANKQIKEIKVIDEKLGIDNITNEKVRMLCKLRLENEAASLLELSEIMSSIMNKTITKSNVNHLFRKIHELYERLEDGRK